jgi:DNA-binding response OmpR family regulator
MPEPPVESISGDTTSATIFVVDPDILVRMVIADYLRDCGYKVVEGVNADDVLAVLGAGRKIYVILTEVQLAGSIDGFELARQIRENHPDVDVILASGVSRVAGKASDLCEDGPLEKPYHPQEVVRRINLLRERRRRSLRP